MEKNLQQEVLLGRGVEPQLPPQLTFNSYRRETIVPYLKDIVYSPNTGLQYENTQTARFLINSTGFIDPYATYLELVIENTDQYILQFDNSAHSLISALSISVNGNVIEEITDYDVIQSFVFDNIYDVEKRKMLSNECFGIASSSLSRGTCEPILYPVTANGLLGDNIRGFYNVGGDADVKNLVNRHVERGIPLVTPIQNKMRLRIPLMSNIFGFGLALQNYKWVPLEIFPNLEISITFNKHGMFHPFAKKAHTGEHNVVTQTGEGFYKNNNVATVGNPFTKYSNSANEVSVVAVVDNYNAYAAVEKRSWKFSEVRLQTSQLFFDSSMLNVIRSLGLKNGFVLDTQFIQSFQHRTVKNPLEQSLLINVPRKSVRSLTTLFLNRTFEKSGCCRKLKRHSRFISSMQVRSGEDLYPYLGNKGNGSNSIGAVNNIDFTKACDKTWYKLGISSSSGIIDSANFALDLHGSDMIFYASKMLAFDGLPFPGIEDIDGITRHADLASLRENPTLGTNICYWYDEEHVGRSAYSVSLDSIPMSGGIYRSGIDTRFNRPIVIQMEQASDAPEFGQYLPTIGPFDQYTFLECDYTLKINGFEIIKEI